MGQVTVEQLKKEYVERRHIKRNDGNTGFGSKHVVLDDINLEFEEGELVCILGISGCGKSTMLRIIAGFDTPSSGRVLIDGKQVNGPSSDHIFVFQHSGLLPWMTVEENVVLGLRHINDEKERQDTVQEHLDMVELGDFGQHFPHQLSGGMQRRTELARALAGNPDMLIMDEPFTGLDFLTHMKIREEVVNMHEFIGKSMIMVTHFIDDAIVMADRIVMLGGNPATVKLNKKLDFSRSRNVDKDPELRELRDELYLMLGVSYVA